MNFYDMFRILKQFLINSGKAADIGVITSAFEYAAALHADQYRKSGEDYICHPIAVAQICANFGFDTNCICAALLHDVVEDCSEETNINEIRKLFGSRVASLVDGLTKFKGMNLISKEEESIRNLRKMFFATSEDLGVMFVKLADRLHNMRTISSMPEEKQKTIALETMHVFAPVAQRLGIRKMKEELEELSFQRLDPIGYKTIKEDIDKKFGESRDFIEDSQEKIKYRLNADNIKFTSEGRVKTVASVHRKVFLKGKSLDEIYDFYAVRYIVNTIDEVYLVLGIIHRMFNHIQSRFKDYISTPKSNGYKSVHTIIINDRGVPMEIQIRTREMHETAEFGVASHWRYKTGEETPKDIEQKLTWLKSLVEAGTDTNDPDEYLSMVKIDIYGDEIFLYTPKGDVKQLTKGSTAVDFAYAIHSDIGNKMTGAKVNGLIYPINSELESGKQVEILTSNSSKGPSRDWLSFVKTGEAGNKI
ncbi:MAG: RelA/SpoT family protein, partial [Oscillospiraceae bacterium]|nr:RelA/SpoT family protein [Oscillospiraceae bacterium]